VVVCKYEAGLKGFVEPDGHVDERVAVMTGGLL
jgi:hypothetical protein